MRTYDHLFFDLDNTLWDFTTNSRLAMEQTLIQNELLSKISSFEAYFEYYEQINQSLWSDYHSKKITKQKLIVERFSRSMQAFGINDYNWNELNSLYLENMALQTQLFPETMEILSTLKSKGYEMHIITNGFREVQYLKLINCGLARFFTKVFISEEIKTTKPHREIFEHALKSTNASKKRSIMIGDSWETDIVGALEFGMDQIMFLNQEKNPIPNAIKSLRVETISSFLELKHHTRTYFIDEIVGLDEVL